MEELLETLRKAETLARDLNLHAERRDLRRMAAKVAREILKGEFNHGP